MRIDLIATDLFIDAPDDVRLPKDLNLTLKPASGYHGYRVTQKGLHPISMLVYIERGEMELSVLQEVYQEEYNRVGVALQNARSELAKRLRK